MAPLSSHESVFLVTCEHASARLPACYGTLGLPAKTLRSHVAWDPGAREVARRLARHLGAEYLEGRYSRLLVDLNRSESNSRIVPRRAHGLPVPANIDLDAAERKGRIARYWSPHRAAVMAAVEHALRSRRRCLHAAVHSFSPDLGAQRARCDIGLLFDPSRPLERRLARRLKELLVGDGLSIRFNYPYRGTSDGLTTALRSAAGRRYAGLEIELSQARLTAPADCRRIAKTLAVALRAAASASTKT